MLIGSGNVRERRPSTVLLGSLVEYADRRGDGVGAEMVPPTTLRDSAVEHRLRGRSRWVATRWTLAWASDSHAATLEGCGAITGPAALWQVLAGAPQNGPLDAPVNFVIPKGDLAPAQSATWRGIGLAPPRCQPRHV